ncbi:hypothetical protein NN3_61290 [Nocardia neocaledoniensis NBRC 108232]|uniref:Uncharacterized protein DUF2599 n=1 Tax=Nocardia neocaledoniensis TaxID=236511 RepID=A0A317NG08_9NOCA|nr:DUF2599 domain-containing protein [Nocardia neocaledoniensis]PWV74241.1 uncharacterized protein DUF2599 [Nocardia neocaledoniensis]GEM35122.1 hypothetical protein NN3_61290 [Nocardia neocaledoniensis NBRC 108232]
MPRWNHPAIVAVALTTALAGCGSPADDDPPAAAPTATTSVRPTSKPPVTIPPPTTTVDPYAGLPLIDHVRWTENIDGARLLVVPTIAGRRTAAPGADELAWQEVLALDPAADAPGMRDQFICHWVWARMVAPDKPSWNLEPWRPAVGYSATVSANCNPGGPER